ncbi:hypothetical protein EYC84_011119 [Monilinia fructicola]|uniref:Uncharacterized protein n=1 Tax=Monilinia fructicola TaxID=38448 RepID=A0A5M9JDZ9_MONFR|nr:hypothetical protein EYC84_011119 [Monilinia fructicola]
MINRNIGALVLWCSSSSRTCGVYPYLSDTGVINYQLDHEDGHWTYTMRGKIDWYNCIIVNAALTAACKYLQLPQITWLVGSYARITTDKAPVYPDWAGIGAKDSRNNLLPGDSKFATKPFSFGDLNKNNLSQEEDRPLSDRDPNDMHQEEDSPLSDRDLEDMLQEEDSPLSDRDLKDMHLEEDGQDSDDVMMHETSSEESLDITIHVTATSSLPKKLFLARRRMDEVMSPSRSLAKNRSIRLSTRASPLQRGEGVPSSSSPFAPSSSPGYTDHGYPDTNMKHIELCAIKWDAQGIEQMTFNLGLWALHMLSAIENTVDANYHNINLDPAYHIFASRYTSISSSG